MAVSERIRDPRIAAGRHDAEDEEAFGLLLVEDVLWGYDIHLIAIHMAASIRGMLSPTTQFSRMNIHQTLLGVFDGQPYLEALCVDPEYVATVRRELAWGLSITNVRSR